MKLYIGIDSGTQSTKGIALDLDSGKVIAEARAPHTLIGGLPEGHMEQHTARPLRRLRASHRHEKDRRPRDDGGVGRCPV